MPLTLKPGTRLYGATSTTEMIAVRAPDAPVELTIGGTEPVQSASERSAGEVADGHGGGCLMGKRYVDDSDTVELLCTKPGDGLPALDGVLLHVKEAKPLPSSD